MERYIHRVHYYETDAMGIVHHSNYVRWMEEARDAYLTQIGWGPENFEKAGIFSSIVSVECNYKRPAFFQDEIVIICSIEEYNGIKLVNGYEMRNAKTDELIFTGKSTMCFIGRDAKLIILKRKFPEFDQLINSLKDVKIK